VQESATHFQEAKLYLRSTAINADSPLTPTQILPKELVVSLSFHRLKANTKIKMLHASPPMSVHAKPGRDETSRSVPTPLHSKLDSALLMVERAPELRPDKVYQNTVHMPHKNTALITIYNVFYITQ
jgi:hypothetical protein